MNIKNDTILCVWRYSSTVQSIDATDVLAAEAFKEEKLRRVHNTIQDVISLVPTGTSELFPGKNYVLEVAKKGAPNV